MCTGYIGTDRSLLTGHNALLLRQIARDLLHAHLILYTDIITHGWPFFNQLSAVLNRDVNMIKESNLSPENMLSITLVCYVHVYQVQPCSYKSMLCGPVRLIHIVTMVTIVTKYTQHHPLHLYQSIYTLYDNNSRELLHWLSFLAQLPWLHILNP